MNGEECWNVVYIDIGIVGDSDFKGNKELPSLQSACPKTLNSVGTNRKSISPNTLSLISSFFSPTFIQRRSSLTSDYFVVAVYRHRISVK